MLFLAKEVLGLKNFSEFCELCLESYVMSEKPIDPHPINEYVKELSARIVRDIRSQTLLISENEAAKLEAEEYRLNRETAVKNAAVRVFLKHRDFARYIPENDPGFEYLDQFERAVSEISQLAGHDVDPAEVIRIYYQETKTKPVGSRETGEDVFGRRVLS